MEKRSRAWRRAQTRRVQVKRWRDLYYSFFKEQALRDLTQRVAYPERYRGRDSYDWINNPKVIGRLRDSHFGCGCQRCKPHKYHNTSKYNSASQLREILNKEEDDYFDL